MGEGRAVGVGVGVGWGVAVGVGVGVGTAVGVGVAVGSGVAVGEGVGVGMGVSVGMAAMTACTSACTVAGMSGVGVGVGVGMACWTAAVTVAGMSGVGEGGAPPTQAAIAVPTRTATAMARKGEAVLDRIMPQKGKSGLIDSITYQLIGLTDVAPVQVDRIIVTVIQSPSAWLRINSAEESVLCPKNRLSDP